MFYRLLPCAILLLAVILTGCPQRTAAPSGPPPGLVAPVSPTPGAAPPQPSGAGPCGIAAIEEAVPDLSFTSVTGEELRLSDLKGKVVLVDFWGIACTGCVEGLDAYQKDPEFVGNDKLEIIAVSRDTNPQAVKQFAKEHLWGFPAVLMTPELKKLLGSDPTLPQVRLIDQQGRLRYRLGSVESTHETVKCLVQQLLGPPQ